MKPNPSLPEPPRLLPLLSGTSAGSLGPEDMLEIGISAAAVDILELSMTFGVDRVERLGGLARLTGWDGPLVAVARVSEGPPAATGWRARVLPQLLGESDGVLRLRSSLDGSVVTVSRAELAEGAFRLGAEPANSLVQPGVEVVEWSGGDPPAMALLVSTLAQDRARDGRFWDSDWAELGPGLAGAGGPLVEGCACRCCAIAGRDYLAHLWAMREITAEHLLGWHNLHQMRLRVEG